VKNLKQKLQIWFKYAQIAFDFMSIFFIIGAVYYMFKDDWVRSNNFLLWTIINSFLGNNCDRKIILSQTYVEVKNGENNEKNEKH